MAHKVLANCVCVAFRFSTFQLHLQMKTKWLLLCVAMYNMALDYRFLVSVFVGSSVYFFSPLFYSRTVRASNF